MLKKFTVDHLDAVVSLHVAVFKDDFLTRLGGGFLRQALYTHFLESENGFGFVCEEEGRLIGYIVGDMNSSLFTRELVGKYFFYIIGGVLSACLRDPAYICEVVRTIIALFGGRIASPYKAELAYIAVDDQARGSGVATALGREFVKYLQGKKCEGCWTKTKKDNRPSNGLYGRLGFVESSQFIYNNAEWVVYTLALNSQ